MLTPVLGLCALSPMIDLAETEVESSPFKPDMSSVYTSKT